MQEIKLSVNDENIETLLIILNNLKSGLILDIQTTKTTKKTQYQPKNGVIYEHESGTKDTNGKYSAAAYKKRLQK